MNVTKKSVRITVAFFREGTKNADFADFPQYRVSMSVLRRQIRNGKRPAVDSFSKR